MEKAPFPTVLAGGSLQERRKPLGGVRKGEAAWRQAQTGWPGLAQEHVLSQSWREAKVHSKQKFIAGTSSWELLPQTTALAYDPKLQMEG